MSDAAQTLHFLDERPAGLSLGMTVSEVQLRTLRRYPDRIALVSEGRSYSYREVSDRISQVMQMFQAQGLERGHGFAVLSANRAAVIFAIWAAQALGLRYTPLHPKGSEDDHAWCLEKAGIRALLVDGHVFSGRGKALAARLDLSHLFVIDGDFGIDLMGEAERFAPQIPVSTAEPEDYCNLYFTGGTTGRPKGAVHRHQQVNTSFMMSMAYWDWPAEVRFLITTPISHAAGGMLTPTLAHGGTFHLLPSFSVESFLETVQRERITATFMVPTMIYDLLDKVRIEDFDLSSLEMIVYGGAPISPTRLKEAIERIGPKFCQIYGQTEVPNLISYLSRSDHDLSRPHLLESCGQPLAPNRMALLGPDGRPVGAGEAGEICIRGPLVMDSYWEAPEETAEAFRDGWLHTGDIARQDAEGYLYIVDRAKDMVISGGFNVFTREVEDCIAQHPAVANVAVFGVPHPRWGETVVAYVVTREGHSVSGNDLVELVKKGKGAVQAPKVVEFVDGLPLTAIGKVDKKALRAAHTGAAALSSRSA
jgi:fatty-acyl-CoA synthase